MDVELENLLQRAAEAQGARQAAAAAAEAAYTAEKAAILAANKAHQALTDYVADLVVKRI
jgi:hypothetical protein